MGMLVSYMTVVLALPLAVGFLVMSLSVALARFRG
jgi:hypothetical protein